METKDETTASIALRLFLNCPDLDNPDAFEYFIQQLDGGHFHQPRAEKLLLTLIYNVGGLRYVVNKKGIEEGIDHLGKNFLILQALWELTVFTEHYPNPKTNNVLQETNQEPIFQEESVPETTEEYLAMAK